MNVYHAFLALTLTLTLACGTRVSLGDLGGDGGHVNIDGALPTDPGLPVNEAGTDGGSPRDANDEPDIDVDADSATPVYKPCAAKACGSACTLCDPLNVTCVEIAVLKECDKAGACTIELATCN